VLHGLLASHILQDVFHSTVRSLRAEKP